MLAQEVRMDEFTADVSIVVNTTTPLSWTVEAINSDGDGGIDVTLFSGPTAEQRAREYARWKYATFHPEMIGT
jgi:hypothetical protein